MRTRTRFTLWSVAALLGLGMTLANPSQAAAPGGAAANAPGGGGRVSFAEDVFPILQNRCLECHKAGAPGLAFSGLNLETYEGLMQGTRFGPVVVPGNAMVSNLNVLVEGRAGIRMPHNRKRLTACEIEILRNWVNQGAKNN
ncbi:hypothetical protein SIID45300_03174 [Candidatus Magnetaquicoccaceae bacterium FCR-1]|uniref:Cytochrome c domain-containing protein n=1 Tax=Candidatus Magnetaquiglobus chichijimensis TaxID=3141448 RepID=A0ABQ0CD61_9PROT